MVLKGHMSAKLMSHRCFQPQARNNKFLLLPFHPSMTSILSASSDSNVSYEYLVILISRYFDFDKSRKSVVKYERFDEEDEEK